MANRILNCNVQNCEITSLFNNVVMYKLPNDQNIREKWITACNFITNKLSTNTFVCSTHFKVEDYVIPSKYIFIKILTKIFSYQNN